MHPLLLILILIDSFYVYGATLPRIGMTILLVLLSIAKGIKVSHIQIVIGVLFMFTFLIGMLNFPDTCLMEVKTFIFLGLYSIILRYKWDLNLINTFLLVTSYLVNFYLLISILLFFIGVVIDLPFLPESDFVITGESFGFSSSVLQSLAFYLTFNGVFFIKKKNLLSAIPFMLGIINVILSQRRAFFIIPSIILLLCYFKYSNVIKNLPKLIFLSIVIIFSIGFFASFFTDMSAIDYILYNFELLGYDEGSDGERIIQFNALWKMFEDSPIWGHGMGAYSTSCIRDVEMPFSYELSVFALLIKFGLPIFVFVILAYMRKICIIFRKNNWILPMAMGSLSLFLSNMTNPYVNVSTVLFLIMPFANWNRGESKLIKDNLL